MYVLFLFHFLFYLIFYFIPTSIFFFCFLFISCFLFPPSIHDLIFSSLLLIFKFRFFLFFNQWLQGGNVIGSGDPKSLDYKNLIKHAGSSVPAPTPATVPVPVPAAQNAFSLDEDF